MTFTKNIEAVLYHIDEYNIGYDLILYHDQATLADYLTALDDFQNTYMESCYGCDGCCWERAPLTSLDLSILRQLAQNNNLTIAALLAQFAQIQVENNGSVDITIKRNEDSSCMFLNKEGKFCNQHLLRPMICHTYMCLPQSQLAKDIRSYIINQGEDELIRLYLQENPCCHWHTGAGVAKIADYPANGFTGKQNGADILLKDLLPADIFQELKTTTPKNN